MAHKQIIGSADAAALLCVDRSTLIRWVQAGKLTPVNRLSDTQTGAWLFDYDDVERLAATRAKARAKAIERLTAAHAKAIERLTAAKAPAA